MSALKTDAIPSTLQANYAETLDRGVINAVEDDLTINEKISIVFLCAAEKMDPDFWTEFMLKLSSYNEKVIFDKGGAQIFIVYDFIKNMGNWKDKFVEALCIINNKRIISQLGLIVDELYREYCPLQARIVGKINVANKILFKFFESLSGKESEKVLKKIYSDIYLDKRLNDINLMEIHALYWLSIGFIRITPANGDLSNLLKYLKPLGYFDTPFYCDIEWYNKKYSANKAHVNSSTNLIKRFKSLLNLTEKPEKIDSDVIIIKKGLCLIINEINFYDPSYETRLGSQMDAINLKKTFQALGFIVEDYENLRAIEIAQKISQHATAINKQYDCFVVCLLSHGYPDGIISVDGQEILFENIEKCMCQKEVQNTLKLVIVQACQGKTMGVNASRNKLAVDGVIADKTKVKPSKNLFTDGFPSNPAKSIYYRKEFLLFKSTMKGYVAIRHKEEGSWFITDICGVLNEFKTQLSIDEWSRQVKKKISLRYGTLDGLKAAGQLAEIERDRRTKEYFFLNQLND